MFNILPISQLAADRQRESAALLCAHLPNAERSKRSAQLLSAIAKGELNPATILAGWWDDCLVGVQVVEILAGGSAALWAIRSRPGEERITFEDALLRGAINLLRTAGVKMAQCLLMSDDQDAADALLRHGFRQLTRVQHLQVGQAPLVTAPAAEAVSFHPYDECDPATFEHILMQSFEGTLDCPELNELRTAEEVLAGHRASASDLSRWWLIRHRDQPAGVLIIADAALPDFWDLAYLGVLSEARRRGIGRVALDFARQRAFAAGKKGLTLMVDERNLPALRLYEQAGFELMAVREVYLWISNR